MTGISSASAHYTDVAKALDAQRHQLDLSLRPLIDATSMISSAAEQAARQLRAFSLPIDIPTLNPVMQSAIATQAIVAALQRSASLVRPNLGTQLLALDKAYAALARPALVASQVFNNASMKLGSLAVAQDFFTQLRHDTLMFADIANSTIAAMALSPDRFLNLSPWLQRAPSVEQYTAARVMEIEFGSTASEIDNDSEELLATLEDRLEARLAAVNVALVEVYRGALAALTGQRPDWRRHMATSLRELVDHLMLALAPDEHVAVFHATNPAAIEGGEFTRRARLQYVFRNIAIGEYSRMAEHDIGLTLATFYPANTTVHGLVSRLTPEQMRVYLRRVQGCISTVLEAGGY